jgi:hypothetical protein
MVGSLENVGVGHGVENKGVGITSAQTAHALGNRPPAATSFAAPGLWRSSALHERFTQISRAHG